MNETFYGINKRRSIENEIDLHAEEILLNGYTIIPNIMTDDILVNLRNKIDDIYKKQFEKFSKDNLDKIGELNMCRAPLLYDLTFVELATNPLVLKVIRYLLGDWIILNLQNAIINRPNIKHHQTAWHRDLPYQNFVISKPIAISALFAIDDFNSKTGGTYFLPFSHKHEDLPSTEYVDKHKIGITAKAGSVIIFDAMIFHRAGDNSSSIIRRAVNHLYTIPIIKQQYDFPKSLKEKINDPNVREILGFTSEVPLNDKVWRENKFQRFNQKIVNDSYEA